MLDHFSGYVSGHGLKKLQNNNATFVAFACCNYCKIIFNYFSKICSELNLLFHLSKPFIDTQSSKM